MGEVTVRMSEKAVRNHAINYLPKTNSNTCNSVYKYAFIVWGGVFVFGLLLVFCFVLFFVCF